MVDRADPDWEEGPDDSDQSSALVVSSTSPDDVDDKDLLKDKCGVVGVVARQPVAGDIYAALQALQHRGQESAGIATVNGSLQRHTGMGLVENVFPAHVLERLEGHVGIGHVRYSTTGGSAVENAQPIVVSSARGDVALAHNGDIVNSKDLRTELQGRGWAFLSTSDTEVAVRLLANELASTTDPVRAIRSVMRDISGAYSFAILIGERLFAARDPLGIKPLVVGRLPDGQGHMVASESTALDVVGATLLRDVAPGEIVEVTLDAIKGHTTPRQDSAHCMFEFVYFARADSIMEGHSIYEVRREIGRILAREAPVEADVIVPVPDSGRTHALGYAAESGVPFTEGLMKNRYVHRTFIMPSQADRTKGVRRKLNAVKSVVEGKRVVLVDDSIVRGTTMRRLITMLREAGAREVHVRIGSPPIVAPCYLGIDMNTRKELVAADHSVKEIQDILGADSLYYISLEGLVAATGQRRKDLCLGCLTSEYPVEVPGEQVRVRHQATLF